jgi:hypothetical protein
MLAHLMCHNTVGAQEVAAVETSEKEKRKVFIQYLPVGR